MTLGAVRKVRRALAESLLHVDEDEDDELLREAMELSLATAKNSTDYIQWSTEPEPEPETEPLLAAVAVRPVATTTTTDQATKASEEAQSWRYETLDTATLEQKLQGRRQTRELLVMMGEATATVDAEIDLMERVVAQRLSRARLPQRYTCDEAASTSFLGQRPARGRGGGGGGRGHVAVGTAEAGAAAWTPPPPAHCTDTQTVLRDAGYGHCAARSSADAAAQRSGAAA